MPLSDSQSKCHAVNKMALLSGIIYDVLYLCGVTIISKQDLDGKVKNNNNNKQVRMQFTMGKWIVIGSRIIPNFTGHMTSSFENPLA